MPVNSVGTNDQQANAADTIYRQMQCRLYRANYLQRICSAHEPRRIIPNCGKVLQIVAAFCVFKIPKIMQFTTSIGYRKAKAFRDALLAP